MRSRSDLPRRHEGVIAKGAIRTRVSRTHRVYSCTGCGNANAGCDTRLDGVWRAAYANDLEAMKLLVAAVRTNIPTVARRRRSAAGRVVIGRSGGPSRRRRSENRVQRSAGAEAVPARWRLRRRRREYGEGSPASHRHARRGWRG